jgi:DNA-binding beta-propeller fold protein YncE
MSLLRRLAPLCALLAAAGVSAQRAATTSQNPRTPGRILVSGYDSNALHAYRAFDGAPRGKAAPVAGAQSIVVGPDGLVYASAEKADRVLRIDPDTLASLGPFVFDDAATPLDETGGLDNPTAAVFGRDGKLYVASFETDSILRYDGTTGAFLDVFVGTGSGGLDGPDAGTKFGPDGHLYVPSYWNHRVLRYDGATGASLGAAIAPQAGGLRNPRDVVFHNGFVYVASSGNDRVLKYDPAGAPLGIFCTANTPYSLAFHPDDRELYVVSVANDNVRIFDGDTGVFLRKVVQNGSAGLGGATFLLFLP